METINKLDNAYGPVGRASGSLLLLAGVILVFYSFSGLILILMGGFIGFTYTSVNVDFYRRRVKFTNMILGIVPVGKWLVIQDDMKIGIKKSNKSWSAYSRGNRELEIPANDYRLILCDSKGREIMAVKKFDSLEEAKISLDVYSKQLGTGVI